ncbi:MAG: hypothetical protein ABI175_28520 [Polyangiales bacterium]
MNPRPLLRLLTAACVASLVACGAQGEIDDELGGPGEDTGGVPIPGTDGGGGIPGDGSAGDGGDLPGTSKIGGAGGLAFDPKDEGSSGVKKDDKGGIIIDPTDWGGSTSPIIWISNSVDATVSKVDTRTMKEIARYRTGPEGSDPSRTTVALNGDVVVVNRGGATATKIAANPVDCVGKGAGTSSGPGDVRAWGDDKCILWNTPFTPGCLGRAGAFDAEKGLDGELSTSVWIGEWGTSKMIQLDSKTGKLLTTVDVAPIKPYGAAIDANHHIWVWGGGVGFIDAATKKFTQIADPPCAYGIAVDPKGRVFTSGGGCVARYTPDAADVTKGKWDSVSIGASNRGLAVDAKGSVWVADTNFGVHQLLTDTLTVVKDIPLAGGGGSFVGMAIDFDGKIWAIDQNAGTGTKIEPGSYALNTVKVGNGPYTYSDMTGFQLRNAADPFGKYRHVFEGCGDMTKWSTLSWTAETPTGTTIQVRVRTSATKAGLKTAAWVVVAKVPGDKSPVDIGTKLGAAAKAQYLEVEFELNSDSPTSTPILSSISVTSACPPAVH